MFAFNMAGHASSLVLAQNGVSDTDLPEITPREYRNRAAAHSPGSSRQTQTTFIDPNELFPNLASPIYAAAPGGLVLSVGTERSFINAARAHATDSLLVLDRDPWARRYVRTNAALLRLAQGDIGLYRHLRFYAPLEEWQEFAAMARNSGALALPLTDFTSRDNFDFWSFWARLKMPLARKFFTDTEEPPFLNRLGYFTLPHDFGEAWPRELQPYQPFYHAQYPHDERLYSNLQSISQTYDIDDVDCDLSDIDRLTRIIGVLHSIGIRLSLFDISTTWLREFIGDGKLEKIVETLGLIASDESILMFTTRTHFPLKDVYAWELGATFQNTDRELAETYFYVYNAFRFGTLREILRERGHLQDVFFNTDRLERMFHDLGYRYFQERQVDDSEILRWIRKHPAVP